MADFKQNYFQRRTKDRGPRSNNRISSPEVQVIGSDGENLGVISTNEAITMAKNQGLDLIEIAANANPPVCKIMDMGKFKYDAQKKANLAKKKQKQDRGRRPARSGSRRRRRALRARRSDPRETSPAARRPSSRPACSR